MAAQGGLAEARGLATIEMIRQHEAALRRTRAALLTLRGGRRRRLSAGAGDRAHESPNGSAPRTHTLDADGHEARGVGDPPQSRAPAGKPAAARAR